MTVTDVPAESVRYRTKCAAGTSACAVLRGLATSISTQIGPFVFSRVRAHRAVRICRVHL